jgi:undecaprenyl diphosphate synthase
MNKIINIFFPAGRNNRLSAKDASLALVPGHIAIIMDGNRRWAQKKNLPKIAGYKVGLEALKDVYETCLSLGVKYLTVYAFSTENMNRPKDEVNYLMWLFIEALNKEIPQLVSRKVRLRILGRKENLEPEMLDKIAAAEKMTEQGDGLNLQVMFNYGGRADIVDAAKKIVALSISGKCPEIDEKLFSDNLCMKGIPDPELLIRTAGEMRISNFLLWEVAYTEIVVTETLFPDFRGRELIAAIEQYIKRERKFGVK